MEAQFDAEAQIGVAEIVNNILTGTDSDGLDPILPPQDPFSPPSCTVKARILK